MTGAPHESRFHPTEVLLSDLGERPVLADTPFGKLAILRSSDGLVAVDAWCPHLDGPLWEGGLSGDEIACPWHGWRYSLRSGECTWAPHGDAEEAAETEIRVLGVRVEESGRLSIEVPEG